MTSWNDLFDGGLQVRPPLDSGQLSGIPARRGVFLLEGQGGQAILLATAADIRARLRFRLAGPGPARTRRADLRELARTVRWKLADSHFETDWRFLQLARAIYPETWRDLLSFRPPWFVRARPEDDVPSLTATNEPPAGEGLYLGPLPGPRPARRLVEVLQDAFDLCRVSPRRGRGDAPGPRRVGADCVYGQIGKCLGLCTGRVSLEDYRRVFRTACDFAGGRRAEFLDDLRRRMQRLAGERQYEQAGQVKARLDRLTELEGPDYRFLGRLEEFRFVMVQPGSKRWQAKAFLVAGGAVRPGGTLEFPPKDRSLRRVLASMGALAGAPGPGARDGEQMALVAHYLFAGGDKAGLAVRFRADLSSDDLRREILAAADQLKLKPPRGRRRPA